MKNAIIIFEKKLKINSYSILFIEKTLKENKY